MPLWRSGYCTPPTLEDNTPFALCTSAAFKGEEGRAVTFKESLGAARVQELINTGLLPVSLQLQHSNETSLHLQQTGALKKITYPTPAADGAEKEDTFAADALLTTRSLSEVIADLRRVLSE